MKRVTNDMRLGFQDSNKLPSYTKLWDELLKFEKQQESGLLHIAPIPDGTTIYVWQKNDEDEWFIHWESYLYGVTEYHYGEVGKDVFTSEEDCKKHKVN